MPMKSNPNIMAMSVIKLLFAYLPIKYKHSLNPQRLTIFTHFKIRRVSAYGEGKGSGARGVYFIMILN